MPQSQIIHAAQALLAEGWAEDVALHVEGGVIREIRRGVAGGKGCLLPAPVNLHSHMFQRAMAGLSEARTAGRDSFWTWRDLMYRFLGQLTPEDVEAIAAQVMVEMAEAGYGAVVEFHYLHHGADGRPYADPAEMSGRIAAAASATGLGLTLLPVLYEQGGCDGRELAGGQLRFKNDFNAFERLLHAASQHVEKLPDGVMGLAPHSLRAVSRGSLARLPSIAGRGPIHLHIAEQMAEVDEVQAAYGARPVEWALDHLPLSRQWCMIHATQMTESETRALARTGAVAGLCPITEANLGDGIFNAVLWRQAGGAWGLGSDSNLRITLSEEMRLLEYSQRLQHRARAVLADHRSTGRVLWEEAAQGGALAGGRGSGRIEVGAPADLLALDLTAQTLEGLRGDRLLDAFTFAGDDRLVSDLWSGGRHIVREGRHVARAPVAEKFRATMARLRERL